MSLLLEALKKAEMIKRGPPPAPTGNVPADTQSAAEPGLTLDFPTAADIAEATPPATPAAGGSEQPFPEISLAELEPREPPAPQPEAAQAEAEVQEPALAAPAGLKVTAPPDEAMPPEPILDLETPAKAEPALTLDFAEPPPQAASPAPEPAGVKAAGLAGMGGLPPESAPLRTDSAPAPLEVPPAAKPGAAIPAPDYSPPKPYHAPAEPAGTLAKDQETAKKILAAQQVTPKRNLKLLGGILIVSMLAGAAAAYFYWQTVSQPRIAVHPQPRPAQPPVAAPPSPQQPGAPAPQPPVAAPQPTAVPPQPITPAADGKPAGQAPSAETQARPAQPKASPADKEKAAKLKPAASDEPDKRSALPPAEQKAGPPDSGIKIRRDAGETLLDPLLASAYQAFMAGDSGKAEVDYRKALQQTPNSRDALLGLAAVAASRGQADEAATHYLRVLQLDPKDAAAQTGLIGLKGYGDPVLSESRLKSLLAQSPNAGYLHFALGNLYAQQSRWPEAQESYFNAFHTEPGNADYAFNLAVSLDHLDQRKAALGYYQRALSLAKERSAGFDRDQLKKRLHELQAN